MRASLGFVVGVAAVTACGESGDPPDIDARSIDATVPPPDAMPSPDAAPVFIAHLIDFDELATGDAVTNQYAPEATFAAAGGQSVVVKSDFDLGTSRPNYICGTLNCNVELSISFGAPVRGLRLVAAGSNSSDLVATVVVHDSSGGQRQQQVFGSNDFMQPIPVDLSATPDIVAIEILDGTDGGGVAWDDISFEYPEDTPPID